MVCKSESKYLMAIIPGDKELDMEKLRMNAQVKNLVLASADEVRDITGCSVAAVPPFGNFFSLDIYVDKRLADEKQIAFNAGSQTKSIKMFYGDFKNLLKMVQGDFAK
jgi:Ala-tRNA(Pro) deacylase